ncbi:MAG TPA: extracellular solute-binding protein [Acetobacteraceae bacterium]
MSTERHIDARNAPGRITRRGVIAAAGVAGLGMPLIARAQPATMTVPNSGGALEDAYRAAYFDTFTKQTGIKILGAPYFDAARIKAMVDNNAVDIDVANIDATEAAVLAQAGLLEPIDYDIIDRKQLLPQAAQPHYMLADIAAYAMGWNTKSFTDATRPKDWGEFFDVKAKPGQRSLWKAAPQTLEVAAMGAGQSRESLYPIDVDKAFGKLDAIKSNLSWWDSGAQGAQLLLGGDADVGAVWNGRLAKPIQDGAPVNLTFDHALYVADAMIIPKGAKNKKYSMQFLANLIRPENQAIFCRRIPYGPVNPATFALLTDAEKDRLPNSPQNSKTAVYQNFDYWAQNGATLIARFNKWLVG